MAEPTVTLQALRRAICKRMLMPFFLRYKNGYLEVDASSTTSKIIDAALTQGDNFWNGSWYYHVSTQEVSLIRSFIATDDWFSLETPLASTPSAGDDYEIHSIWNAIEIHEAINDAIRKGGRTFPESIVDESLILQEDKLSYDISGLNSRVWKVSKVFIENSRKAKRGTVVSATSSTATLESSSVTEDISTASNWRISIYEGTGKGQIRTLSSKSGAQVTVSSNWTTTPSIDSKYALWDTTEELTDWVPLHNYRFDSKEFPNTLYIDGRYSSHYGMRIHLEYMTLPSELSAEADTTIIPQDYIVPMAMSALYGTHIKLQKADKETYYAESQRLKEEAEQYVVNNAPHKMDSQMRFPLRRGARGGVGEDNPLGW